MMIKGTPHYYAASGMSIVSLWVEPDGVAVAVNVLVPDEAVDVRTSVHMSWEQFSELTSDASRIVACRPADLDNTVNSFQAALQKNDTGTMLKLQRQLSDQAAQADSSLKDAQSKPADEVRAAVDALATCVLVATSERLLADRGVNA